MPLRTLFVDLNSFFASVEQQLDPEIRGKPVAVVPVEADTTSCIAASYEAKKFGVKTGTRVGEAKRMCPGLICVRARHTAYIEFHHKVLAAADTVLPVNSIHSIDEFSCRLMGAERERGKAEQLARSMKQAISIRVGECLTCSIGVAPNRFLAKVGSDMQKPDGLVIIDNVDLPGKLLTLTPRDLPGIGPKMEERLRRAGVTRIEQLLEASEARMTELFESVVGSFYFAALRGEDLPERPTARRTIGHQHVLGPDHRNDEHARAVAVRLLDKAAARARSLGYWTRRLSVSLKYIGRSEWGAHASFPECNDTMTLMSRLAELWHKHPPGKVLRVSVTLEELKESGASTGSLFESDQKKARLSETVDKINESLGRAAVYPASMQRARKSAPAKIAFRNIPDLKLPHVKEAAEGEAEDRRE